MIEDIIVSIKSTMSGFNKSIDSVKGSLNSTKQNMMGFNSVMGMNFDKWKKSSSAISQFGSTGGKVANTVRLLTHGLQGFRMEMLGVMFFGMGMQQMFMGWLQPALEAMGIFELFKTTLMVLFLPIAELLLPLFLSIMDFFINLPESVQLAIGIFAVLGVVLGTLLFVIGSLALGIGSLILMFSSGPIVAVGATIIPAITAAFIPLLAIIGLVILVAAGIYSAWNDNFLGMKTIVETFIIGLKLVFGGLVNIVSGIIKSVYALFTGDTTTFVNSIKKIIFGIIQVILGLLYSIGSVILSIIIGLVKSFNNVIKVFNEIGRNMMMYLINGINSMANAVATALWNVLPQWFRDMIKGVGTFAGGVASKIAGGLKSSLGIESTFVKPISTTPISDLGYTPANKQVSVNTTNNFYGFTQNDLEKSLNESEKKMVDSISKQVKQ